MKKDVWKQQWIRGEKLDGGNQGHTHLARRIDSGDGCFDFVLKTLRRQDDKERRERFYLETACLRILEHDQISKLADTNAENFRENDELFLVTERVVGTDLEKLVNSRGAVTASTAAGLMLRVLEILEYCHGKNVVHRDLKPCHIILRNDDVNVPVIIDFGLAFNEEEHPTDLETATQQGVGNRFIIMPEQLGQGSDKRDQRSDLTQCVGILFYLTTGRIPGIIVGHRGGAKPHQRFEFASVVQASNSAQLDALTAIFDTGFEWDIERRWQSIESFRSQLLLIFGGESSQTVRVAFEQRIAEMRRRIDTSPEYQLVAKIPTLFSQLSTSFQNSWGQINQFLSDVLTLTMQGVHNDQKRRQFGMSCTIHKKHDDKEIRQIMALIEIEGYEVVANIGYFPATAGVLGFWAKLPPTAVKRSIRIGAFAPDVALQIQNAFEDCLADAVTATVG